MSFLHHWGGTVQRRVKTEATAMPIKLTPADAIRCSLPIADVLMPDCSRIVY